MACGSVVEAVAEVVCLDLDSGYVGGARVQVREQVREQSGGTRRLGASGPMGSLRS